MGINILVEQTNTGSSKDDEDDNPIEVVLKLVVLVDPVENWFLICGGWNAGNNVSNIRGDFDHLYNLHLIRPDHSAKSRPEAS